VNDNTPHVGVSTVGVTDATGPVGKSALPGQAATTTPGEVTTSSVPGQDATTTPGEVTTSSTFTDVVSGLTDLGNLITGDAAQVLGAWAPIVNGVLGYLSGQDAADARQWIQGIANGQLGNSDQAFQAFMQRFGDKVPPDQLQALMNNPTPDARTALDQYANTGIPDIQSLRDKRLADFRNATSGLTGLEDRLVGHALDKVAQTYAPLLNAYGVSGTTGANILAARGADAVDNVLLDIQKERDQNAQTALQYGFKYDNIVNDSQQWVVKSWADLNKTEADITRSIYDSLTGVRQSDLTALGNVATSFSDSGSNTAQAFADQTTGANTAIGSALQALGGFGTQGGGTTVNVNATGGNATGGAGGTGQGGQGGVGQGGQGGGGGQTFLDKLGGFGKTALQGVGMYVSMVPGMDTVVQDLANGTAGKAVGDFADNVVSGIKNLGGKIAGAFGFGGTALMDSAGNMTETGAQVVNELMANGVDGATALNAVAQAGGGAIAGGAALVDAGGQITEAGAAAINGLMSTGMGFEEASQAVMGANAASFVGPPAPSGAGTAGTAGTSGTSSAGATAANIGAGIAGGMAGTYTASQFTKHWKLSKSGQLTQSGGAAAGAAYGASVGATAGSIIPGAGTAVGALIGAFVGAVAGWFGGSAIGRGLFGDGDKHGLSHTARRGIDVLHKYAKDIPAGEGDFQSWLTEQSGGEYDTGKNLEDANNEMVDQVAMMTFSMVDPSQREQAASDYFIGAKGAGGGKGPGGHQFNNGSDAAKFAMLTDDAFFKAVIANTDPTRSGNNDRNVLTGGIYAGDKPGTVVYDKFKELSDKYGIRHTDTGDFAHDLGVFVKHLNTMNPDLFNGSQQSADVSTQSATPATPTTPTTPTTPGAPMGAVVKTPNGKYRWR
jgi:hypothetical protein